MSSFKTYPNYKNPDFSSVTPEDLQFFRQLIGESNVSTDSETLFDYSHDWTEDFSFLPEVVLKPKTTQEVAHIMAYCHERVLPVTPAGAMTGLSGGALPIFGGISLSLVRMNEILNLDTQNLQITVQPGVITQTIHQTVEEVGLFYPPDPSSRGSCTIGGNIAENAGGVRAVKYGVTNEYVLALEVVTPTGEIIRTGAKVLKNSTGLNLTQLIVGSEGILGIVTEATLKLVVKPLFHASLLIPFLKADQACNAVSDILQASITPSAIEFMEVDALIFGQKYLNIDKYNTDGVAGHLLIALDGRTAEEIVQQSDALVEVISKFDIGEIYYADDQTKEDELWRLRRCLGEAVKGTTIYKEEDIVVPRAELAKILTFVKDCGREYQFDSVCYGHAGDGNLHVNIIKNKMSDDNWNKILPAAIEKIFKYVVQLGGTLSGEHGIGYVQRRYLNIAFSPHELFLMRKIKKAFDPKGIMNPAKAI